jgi:hypothetical protein
VRWSVRIEAEGDRALTGAEIAALADALAATHGSVIDSGTTRYGAQLVVRTDSREDAVDMATDEFWRAVRKAGIRPGPLVRAEAVNDPPGS